LPGMASPVCKMQTLLSHLASLKSAQINKILYIEAVGMWQFFYTYRNVPDAELLVMGMYGEYVHVSDKPA
jgi:hypothetical protein